MSRRGIRERFRDWLRRWRDFRAKHLVFVFLHARRLIASNEDRQLPFRAEAAQRLQSRGRLCGGSVAHDSGGIDFPSRGHCAAMGDEDSCCCHHLWPPGGDFLVRV